MFPMLTDAPFYAEEDDGPMMTFDDVAIPVEHEVRNFSFVMICVLFPVAIRPT